MKRKYMTIAAMALAAALAVGACARESGQMTFTGDKSEEPAYQSNLNPIAPSAYGDVRGLKLEKGTYISIIGKSEGTAFWQAVRSGVLQAAEDLNTELGYTGGDKIKVTYNAPARTEDIDEQVNILDEELSRYPDVIGIASVDEEACTVQFDLATENGIPIIALDSGNQYPGIQCTVKTDNQEAARTGAYKLADEIDKKGDVMLLVHDSKSETARERVKSFQEEMEENHSDIRVAEVIYCDALDDIKKQMAEEQNEGLKEDERKVEKESFSDIDAVQYMIEQHPGLKGIFATNDRTTMLGLEAIRQAEKVREERSAQEQRQDDKQPSEQDTQESNKTIDGDEEQTSTPESGNEDREDEDVKIVLMGFDVSKEQLKALEAGEISGLVVQNPFGIGYASVVAAARTVLEAGNEAQVSTGYLWVTKDNMNDESIRKMLYE